MIDFLLTLVVVAALVALALSPALLPQSIPLVFRWGLSLVLLALSIWMKRRSAGSPHGFEMIILLPFWLFWAGGVVWLLIKTRRRQ